MQIVANLEVGKRSEKELSILDQQVLEKNKKLETFADETSKINIEVKKTNRELRDKIKLLEEEQDMIEKKQHEQQILFRGEKGMNGTLKSQIETLSFTIEELVELNSKYLTQIGVLRQELIRHIQNLRK